MDVLSATIATTEQQLNGLRRQLRSIKRRESHRQYYKAHKEDLLTAMKLRRANKPPTTWTCTCCNKVMQRANRRAHERSEKHIRLSASAVHGTSAYSTSDNPAKEQP